MNSILYKTPDFRFITLHKNVINMGVSTKFRKQFSKHCLCITHENSSTCMTFSVINCSKKKAKKINDEFTHSYTFPGKILKK